MAINIGEDRLLDLSCFPSIIDASKNGALDKMVTYY
jgi:hypothetical protein